MAENQPKSEVAKREEEILAFWKERDIFRKSLEKESPKGDFVFYEGPPTANGKPGIHHLESRAFKDAIPRFRTMQGYHVRRKAGWDTHGLPVELEVEKQIGSKNKKDIEAFGIAKFNALCKESVLKYIGDWEKFSDRIAFWQDYEHTYFTFDNSYIESVWNVLKTANEKKLLYKDYKVVPWCPRCGTALSSHEVAQGYQDDVEDPSVYVKFKVKNPEHINFENPKGKNVYLLAWTTTPWTLPGNVALAVSPHVQYEAFEKDGEIYIFAHRREIFERLFPKDESNVHYEENTWFILGKNLVGLEYEPLFSYLKDTLPEKEKAKLPNAYKVYAADFVSTEDGTGIVHTAVMYGTDDFELGTKVGLPKHHLLGEDGKFTADAPPLAGQFFKKADTWIENDLHERGLLFNKPGEKIKHTYPFCWRCKTPLMYYADDSWYIAMSTIKEKLISENESIHWEPEHIRDGRFGEWLKDLKDWAISRSRFWGTPLPIWECAECKNFEVIGSIAELKEKTGSAPQDLHRPYVDDLSYTCFKCGGAMKKVPEVLDVWFDSGAMPFAQDHYPFATKEILYPADYISEAIDQTRGWFYTLHAVGAGIMGRGRAYRNVICLGHVLDAKGKKMSKSLGNVVEPWSMIDKYGVDALRYFMFTVNAPGDSKNFDERMVDEIVKKNLGRLNNVLAFYKLYENGTSRGDTSHHVLDRWIVARLNEVVEQATNGFDNYKLDQAMRPLTGFIDDLSVWYLRRSRDRFKEDTEDKKSALATLRFVLFTLAQLMAPSMPFFAEHLYQAVKESGDKESVHLSSWPEAKGKSFMRSILGLESTDPIMGSMEIIRLFASRALKERESKNIKVRQPLKSLTIPRGTYLSEKTKELDDFLALLKDEINVKDIHFEDRIGVELDTNLTDELREEGVVRDTIREIQAFRKENGLKPGEKASYKANFSPEQRTVVEKNLDAIQKTTHTSIEFN